MQSCAHPTADEVYYDVAKQCPSISKGTVYRNLNQLAADGEILRIMVANAPDRFDKTTTEHYHLKCLSCGRIFDIDCGNAIDLTKVSNGDFEVTGCDVLFCGYCKECTQAAKRGKVN